MLINAPTAAAEAKPRGRALSPSLPRVKLFCLCLGNCIWGVFCNACYWSITGYFLLAHCLAYFSALEVQLHLSFVLYNLSVVEMTYGKPVVHMSSLTVCCNRLAAVLISTGICLALWEAYQATNDGC